MNFLIIISDTLRRDHLGCYGNPSIHTPNLDRLARESVVLDEAYSASFPTLPCRAEIFTGRFVFPWLSWGPLPQHLPVLSEALAAAHYTCALVSDNPHFFRPGYWFERGFHTSVRIRGQFQDNLAPTETAFVWPCPPELLGDDRDGKVKQHLRNTAGRRDEDEWFAPRVVREAVHWLEANHRRGPFLLHVDLFDPHEPWDPPPADVDRYDPERSAPDIIRPDFGRADKYSAAELRRIRALYAGEVTHMDRWVGVLLQSLEALGLAEDTAVVFLSDHGILLGERNLLGKSDGKRESMRGWPLYPEVARIPMLWRVPGLSPARRPGFVHPGDLGPTLLELAGVQPPASFKTQSLLPLLRGETEALRSLSVSSWSLKDVSAFRPSVIRDGEWSLVFWRTGIRCELYNRRDDPGEERDVYAAHPQEARRLHREYVRFLREHDAPPRNLWPRRWLVTWDGRAAGVQATPVVRKDVATGGAGR